MSGHKWSEEESEITPQVGTLPHISKAKDEVREPKCTATTCPGGDGGVCFTKPRQHPKQKRRPSKETGAREKRRTK